VHPAHLGSHVCQVLTVWSRRREKNFYFGDLDKTALPPRVRQEAAECDCNRSFERRHHRVRVRHAGPREGPAPGGF